MLRTLEGNGGAETPIGLARFPGISTALADLLCAFDLIALDQDQVRFSDADILSNASELVAEGLEPLEILRALTARRAAPTGRHRLAADEHGKPVLAWDDGLTTLSGQGLLPLDEKDGLEAAFEQAMEAEFAGRFD